MRIQRGVILLVSVFALSVMTVNAQRGGRGGQDGQPVPPAPPNPRLDALKKDVVADIETSYQRVATDPTDQPSANLHEKLQEGHLGEKSGRGFYMHPDPEYTRAGWLTGEEEHDG